MKDIKELTQEELEQKAKELLEKKKRIIRLHYHPEQIKKSITDFREMSETAEVADLFEDIEVLVDWALKRLPLVPPPDKEEGQEVS